MTIEWIPLLAGILLGAIPPRLLINSEVRYLRFDALWRRIAEPQKTGRRRRRWWKLPFVWIDPIRGYVVGDLLLHAFRSTPGAYGIEALVPKLLLFACLSVIILVQTSGRTPFRECVAPCGFLAGALFALMPWIVALSAVVLGASAMVALTRFVAGFFVSTLATASIGYFFIGLSPWLLGCTTLVALPMLVSWFRDRSLVMPMRM